MRLLHASLTPSAPAVLRTLALVSLAVAATDRVQGQTVLFNDSFDGEVVGTAAQGQFEEGPVGTTGWTFVRDEAFQSDVRFGYDYSSITSTDGTLTVSIPEAPNTKPGDAPTTGVSLRTNVSSGAADQAGIFYEDETFTGSYQVQVDMFLSWAADADRIGTTEHGGLFIGKDTDTNPASTDFPASTGAGVIFSSDGDTANFDHTILKNNVYPSTASGQFSVTDFGFGPQLGFDNTDVNTNLANGDLIDLPALYPEIDLGGGITQQSGVVGFRWVTLTADVDTNAIGNGTGTVPGTTTFSVTIAETGQSYTMGTIDNSVIVDLPDGTLTGQVTETEQGPVDMSGRATLTLIDFFTSVASDINLATVVFDNFLVTAIEPTLEGDYNGDGEVNAADYTVYRDTLGVTVPVGEGADGNGNGLIDTGDYVVWATNFGDSLPPLGSAVPEPSTMLIAALSLGVLAARGRCF